MAETLSSETIDIVRRFGGSVPEDIFNDIVDTGPTLDNWSNIKPYIDDMVFVTKVMATAYDAAVYSLGRHRQNDPNALDLPIGAAIGDPVQGLFYGGFAQDKELDDNSAHAEVMAMCHYLELYHGEDIVPKSLGGLTLATTLEPCPNCLDHLEASGISRVVYGASRVELEDSEILKRHHLKAPDIVRQARKRRGGYPFEFFKFPHSAIQSATIEIFSSFNRDLQTEKVVFDRDFSHSTRYNTFATDLDQDRSPIIGTDEERLEKRETQPKQQSEDEALLSNFLAVIDSYAGKPGVNKTSY